MLLSGGAVQSAKGHGHRDEADSDLSASSARSLTANSMATAGTRLQSQIGRPRKQPPTPCVRSLRRI